MKYISKLSSSVSSINNLSSEITSFIKDVWISSDDDNKHIRSITFFNSLILPGHECSFNKFIPSWVMNLCMFLSEEYLFKKDIVKSEISSNLSFNDGIFIGTTLSL